MNGYKEIMDIVIKKVDEMIQDCYNDKFYCGSTVINDLVQIKKEIDSVGTRPHIILKRPVPEKSLKEQIDLARKRLDEANTEFYEIYNKCTAHDIQGTEYGAAQCKICGRHFGWFCPDSPTKHCEYSKGTEDCDFCGLPSERK